MWLCAKVTFQLLKLGGPVTFKMHRADQNSVADGHRGIVEFMPVYVYKLRLLFLKIKRLVWKNQIAFDWIYCVLFTDDGTDD